MFRVFLNIQEVINWVFLIFVLILAFTPLGIGQWLLMAGLWLLNNYMIGKLRRLLDENERR